MPTTTRAKKRATARVRCRFNDVVREKLAAAQMSQRVLAETAGIDQATLWRALEANGAVHVSTLEAVADALGVDPGAFWAAA